MPESLIVCPSCGYEVPRGKYCNLCGEPLLPSKSEESTGTEEPSPSQASVPVKTDEEQGSTEPVSLPRFEIVIQDMPYEVSTILLASAELKVLDDELSRIIEQIKATRQALQLRQADRAVLTGRAEALREEFERTKARRHELASVKEKLLLESLLEALDRHEERLSKLENVAGTLDKDVYNEQRIEILQNIKDVRIHLKEAIKTSSKWAKGIKNTLRTLEKERSRLDAKFKIGDIPREKYESSRTRLERTIKIIEGSQRRLDELLDQTKKR
jgi:chromosome segregation ATPase